MGDILEPLDAIHDSGVDQADDEAQATGGHWADDGLLADSRMLLVGTWWEKLRQCASKLNFARKKKESESKVPLQMKNNSTFFSDIFGSEQN